MSNQRPRRQMVEQRDDMHPLVRKYFLTGESNIDEIRTANVGMVILELSPCRPGLAAAWKQYGVDLTREWVREHPGTRPWAWWVIDAPEPRQRVGGIGTPRGTSSSDFGIPAYWWSQWEVDYYNGRNIADKDRNHWNRDYVEGSFPHPAIDPLDPPLFESEATYLRRLGLFMPGEAARLTEDDYAPEPLFDLGDDPIAVEAT